MRGALLSLLTPLLALLGCGADPFAGSGHLGEAPQATARIEGWAEGAGLRIDALVSGAAVSPVLASAAVAADGSFPVPFPPRAEVEGHLGPFAAPPPGCSSSVVVSPPSLRVGALLHVLAREGQPPTPLMLANVPPVEGRLPLAGTGVTFLYASEGARVSGAIRCEGPGPSSRSDYDLSLEPGWNMMLSTLRGDSTPEELRGDVRSGGMRAARWFLLR